MPRVHLPDGRVVNFPDGMPEADIAKALDEINGVKPAEKSGGMLQTAKDVGIGALKGVGSTLANAVELMGNAGALPGVTPTGLSPELRHPAFQKAEEATTASNDAQRAGKVAEGVGEFALGGGAALNSIPRMGRASTKFAKVAQVANKVPLNVEAPGQVALRMAQLGERGGQEPRVIGKLLRRLTDPAKAPMEFEEGRDFYSNISRLSANDFNSLNPVMQREMGNLRTALNGSLTDAAGSVGRGAEYSSAMKEYAQAAKIQAMKNELINALKQRALPYAGAAGVGAGVGGWIGSKLAGLTGSVFEE